MPKKTREQPVTKFLKEQSNFPHPLTALSARELERSCKRGKVYILLVLRVEKQFKPVTSTTRRKRQLVSSTVKMQMPRAGKVFQFFFTLLCFIGIDPYSVRVLELDVCRNCTQLFLRRTASSSGD